MTDVMDPGWGIHQAVWGHSVISVKGKDDELVKLIRAARDSGGCWMVAGGW
jgi:hypothetical protein